MRAAQYQIRPVLVRGRAQWHWRLRAANGRIVAAGEHYTSRRGAERGVEAHRRAAASAAVVVLEAAARG